MKIDFLMYSAYGQAGTSVATQTLANALAARGHDVQLVSCFQYHDRPPLSFAPDVRLRTLVDTRSGSADLKDPLHEVPSEVCTGFKADDKNRYSKLLDERAAAHLRGTDADVVIATAPNTIALLAASGTGRYVTLGQAHTHYHHQTAASRKMLDAAIPNLDAFVTVTARDAQTHRDAYGAVGTVFHAIPNAVTSTFMRADVGNSRIVTASGRFVDWKRFDLLINAFAQLGTRHPDWTLRIYGNGAERGNLRKLIDTLGANERIQLMGHTQHLREELAKAALHTSTSTDETFGLTIVEAMTCGVPVLSTAGPHGPSEIVSDGIDGVLSPVGDVDAFAKNLDLLMSDAELRVRLGAGALEKARAYSSEAQAETYEVFLHQLAAGRDFRPEALCRATAAGDLEFVLDPASAPGGRFSVLCVNAADGRQAMMVGPVEQTANGHLYATVPARIRLATGAWNVLLRREDDGVLRRIRIKELQQTANALISAPEEHGPVRFRTFVRSEDGGYLRIASRELAAHAEVLSVEMNGPHLFVQLYPFGVVPSPTAGPEVDLAGQGAQIIAQSRKNKDAFFTVPCAFAPGQTGFTLDLHQYADRMVGVDSGWDLSLAIPGHLTADGQTHKLRLGRFRDDVLKRKPVYVYPKNTITTMDGRSVTYHPYYTDSNLLSIAIKPA
ncbi:glycosyltransferase [Streptomyces sp. NPDC101160]|uniref:glycosyltransferase n=1 Tax=Streptomyces sp. NPDC101160 TaxID=3366118 RepID=UPI0038126715